MILRHWNLRRDPFLEGGSGYIATAVHEEAVARLVHAVEARERSVSVVAGPGLGKTTVVEEALGRLRHPLRRVARSVAPADGPTLLADLARRLGGAVPATAGRAVAWRALADAARLCRAQGIALVLVVDDAHWLTEPAAQEDLERLPAIDPHPSARVSVIRLGRPGDEAGQLEPEPWELAIRLVPLTRTEADGYLRAKLANAGRAEPLFTPRAVSRLHALAGGVPRGLDQLAALALAAGALRGLEMIGPEILNGVAAECAPEPAWT